MTTFWSMRLINSVVLAGLGLVLVVLGRWGRRGAEELGVPPGLPDDRARRRAAVIRRGATASAVVGVMFVLLAIATFIP